MDFHTIMNFLGAIGTLMENTGLSNSLKVVYKEHTVPHMMTGKAISRGSRDCRSMLVYTSGQYIYGRNRRYNETAVVNIIFFT